MKKTMPLLYILSFIIILQSFQLVNATSKTFKLFPSGILGKHITELQKGDHIEGSFSINNLAQDLQVAFDTVKNWLLLFDSFYLTFRISPWTEKISRSILKEKKVSVVPGEVFGSAGKTHVRLSLTINMNSLEEGLERIEEYMNR